MSKYALIAPGGGGGDIDSCTRSSTVESSSGEADAMSVRLRRTSMTRMVVSSDSGPPPVAIAVAGSVMVSSAIRGLSIRAQ